MAMGEAGGDQGGAGGNVGALVGGASMNAILSQACMILLLTKKIDGYDR
jgi:hypothetical protein